MKKIINKGYTLTVKSYENDGDNYNTKTKTVETKEQAKIWWDLMQLCRSKNKQRGCLGNTLGEFTREQRIVAIDFLKTNKNILLPNHSLDEISDEDLQYWFCDILDEDLQYWFCDLAEELIGHSKGYMCRVMESCLITYSPEDIFLEEVIF